MEEVHRVFVGGLFNSITEDELKSRFQSFGSVSDVTIIQKKDGEGNISKTFGYVNLLTSNQKLNRCFAVFGGTKWKGSVLKVQLAKEDFIARLKRERLEPDVKVKNKKRRSSGPTKTYSDILETTSTMKRIVPGTPVEGEKDWVVAKYGRPLPIVNLPKASGKKTVKVDPSKFCHCLKRLPDTGDDNVVVDKLTWTYDDSEMILKKKKKKKSKKEDTDCDVEIPNVTDVKDNESQKKRKKSVDNEDKIACDKTTILTEKPESKKKKKKSKMKENISALPNDTIIENDKCDIETTTMSGKKKKKKLKLEESSILSAQDLEQRETKSYELTNVLPKNKDENGEGDQESKVQDDNETADTKCEIPSEKFFIPEFITDPEEDISACYDESDGNVLSTSIVEQLLSLSQKNNESNSKVLENDFNLESQVSSNSHLHDNSKLENEVHNDVDEDIVDKEVQENLFDFEFEDIGGNKDNKFLDSLLGSIEVRENMDEKNTSSEDESSCSDDFIDSPNNINISTDDLIVESSSQNISQSVDDISNEGCLTSSIMETNAANENEYNSNLGDDSGMVINKVVDDNSNIRASSEIIETNSSTDTEDNSKKIIEMHKFEIVGNKTNDDKKIKKSKILNSNKQEKHALSEEKRKMSLEVRNSQIMQNKGLVSKALKEVDKTFNSTNRIVFDSDDDEEDVSSTIIDVSVENKTTDENKDEEVNCKNNVKLSKKDSKKQATLFDDSDGEDAASEDEIVVKPQFQGKEGEKLFKMQQKFGGDERFKLDERFAELDPTEEKDIESDEDVEDDEENEIRKEKEMNISVLEQILGKSVTEKKEKEFKQQRYDPDDEEHEKFEVKTKPTDEKENEDEDEGTVPKVKKAAAPVITLPEVSKDTYYSVNESLKDLFGKTESTSFSFLGGESPASFSFLGGEDDQSSPTYDVENLPEPVDQSMDVTDEPEKEMIKEPYWKKGLKNMLVSGHEECEESIVDSEKVDQESQNKHSTYLFFADDDERLSIGSRFKRTEEIEEINSQWKTLRKTLTEDYKKKHKDAVRRVRKLRESRFSRR